MTPNYLSEPELFVKADTPYDTRDTCKLIQPLKRTSTYGLRSFQYYGAHVWNILPRNIKAAQSLHKFKSLIRSWPGPTCSCHICTALLWLMIDWLIVFISIDATPIRTLGTRLPVWRLCWRLWHRGLSLWRPAVPLVDEESSQWQLLSVLVFIPYEYACHQIVDRADMCISFMFCFTIINDWLVDRLLFRIMPLRNMYTGDGAVGVTTMSSLVAPRVVLVTACGATGRCEVVTLTAPLCFSVYTLRILIVLVSINANNVHWGRGCQCDDLLSLVAPRVVFVTTRGATGSCGFVTLTAPPCSNACISQIYMLSFRRVHTYWYLNSLALRPNGRHLLINFCILQAVPWNPNWKCVV